MTDTALYPHRRPSPVFHPPSEAEIRARVVRLGAALAERGLDYYVAISPDNIFYLTHFANYVHERPFVLVIDRDATMRFLVPKLEIPHVRRRTVGPLELISYAEFPAPHGDRWSDRFATLFFPPGARVGIETVCPQFLSAEVPGEVVPIDLIDDLRMVKTPYELARIQYASDLASAAHARFLARAEIGRSLREAGAEGTRGLMATLVADNPSINPLATKVAFLFQPPSVSDDPHNFTDIHMSMEPGGPHVSIINGVFNGYGTEIERTFFLKSIPEEAIRPFETMMEARDAALSRIRPGASMDEVDRAANAVFAKAGYEKNLLHRAGHGIGVTGHEAPFFAEGYDREIRPGMVFTLEPGLYIPGTGGFRHSDTLFVSDEGPVMMTEAPCRLEELVVG